MLVCYPAKVNISKASKALSLVLGKKRRGVHVGDDLGLSSKLSASFDAVGKEIVS